MLNVLWLCSWYPNKLSPYNGDFIQRHAQAASLNNKIHVIHLAPDDGIAAIHVDENKDIYYPQLIERLIYYPKSNTVLGKIKARYAWRKLYKKEIKEYISTYGIPNLIHVHIGMNAGLLALWAKKKFNIPYVVTEHWSGFLNESGDNKLKSDKWYRFLWKNILNNANEISAVSNYLKESILSFSPTGKFKIVPNVVDTKVFKLRIQKKFEEIVFVHVSQLGPHKNPQLIIQAFEKVAKKYQTTKLKIIGQDSDKLIPYINACEVNDRVILYPHINQDEVAKHLQESDALILYSSYETFGCVIIEANACGIPVIISDINVFHENVTEGVNGLFATPNSPLHLAKRMEDIINNKYNFDPKSISANAQERFSYPVIGSVFDKWYQEIVKL